MGLSVTTNLAAMNARRSLSTTSDAMSTSLRRLSSGYRITKAADDAAGLAISEGLRSQIGGMTQAVRNTQDGTNVVQTAEGALNETTSILQRMRDLAVQAANDGGVNRDGRSAIQKEIVQLKTELTRISQTTTFNGTPLLDGTFTGKAFQVGANVGETITVDIVDGASAEALGVDTVDVTAGPRLTATVTAAVSDDEGTPAPGRVKLDGDFSDPGPYAATYTGLSGTITYNGKTFDLGSVDYSGATTSQQFLERLNDAVMPVLGTGGYPFATTTAALYFGGDTPTAGSTPADAAALSPTYKGSTGAQDAITVISEAIGTASSLRADLGVLQNRFEHTIDNLNVAIENTAASESRIRDTDMAAEMTRFSRSQVLTQAGTSMLAQANQSTQSILKLLG
jgi:flagellin-like hook-associated protein FlgL